MEERDKKYISYILLLAVGLFTGTCLRNCSEPTYTEPTEKIVKQIEEKNIYIKEQVKGLKEIVEKEDKRKVDSLTFKLDSIMAIKNFNKDTALFTCIDLVGAQKELIKRQDTIILKQDTIIYNDSLIINLLKQEVKVEKKKARKNMFKGIGIGFVGGILTGVLVKNT